MTDRALFTPAEVTGMTWDQISRFINQRLADRGGEWCGIPMPVHGLALTVESRNPWRERIAHIDQVVNPPTQTTATDADEYVVVNRWWSKSRNGEIVIAIDPTTGKRFAVQVSHQNGVKWRAHFGTLQASQVWSLEAELTAIDKLAALIPQHLFASYVMTGTFIETSRRSGITYQFRRNRPTIAMKHKLPDQFGPRRTPDPESVSILCGLCLHPIGYYDGTWAGSMVPTDEVIAHLLLMRGDEHLYWRRANQHGAHSPLLGL
jgi:hypothetical protein